MDINLEQLTSEKIGLQKDFDTLGKNIKQVETDLVQMKANLNAINGAVQQVDRLINKIKNEGDEKSKAIKEMVAKG